MQSLKKEISSTETRARPEIKVTAYRFLRISGLENSIAFNAAQSIVHNVPVLCMFFIALLRLQHASTRKMFHRLQLEIQECEARVTSVIVPIPLRFLRHDPGIHVTHFHPKLRTSSIDASSPNIGEEPAMLAYIHAESSQTEQSLLFHVRQQCFKQFPKCSHVQDSATDQPHAICPLCSFALVEHAVVPAANRIGSGQNDSCSEEYWENDQALNALIAGRFYDTAVCKAADAEEHSVLVDCSHDDDHHMIPSLQSSEASQLWRQFGMTVRLPFDIPQGITITPILVPSKHVLHRMYSKTCTKAIMDRNLVFVKVVNA